MPNKTGVVRLVGKLNEANDAFPGGGDASPGLVPGMLGVEIELDGTQAAALSKTSTGTLRAGRYRYVQTLSSGTAAPARGLLAFVGTSAQWNSDTVHSDGGATLDGKVVGVFLNTVTKGNCTWIQVAGDADVSFKSGVAVTTDGTLVVVDTTTNKADAVADATGTLTYGHIKRIFGVALGTVTDNAINKVLLKIVPARGGDN
jgi:hypothetical protein